MSSIIQEVRKLDDAVIVALVGELTFEHSPDFHRSLQQIDAESPRHLILELSQLSYIDSSGVGTLVDMFRRFRAREGILSLVAPQKTVLSVFEITKLINFFPIFDSVEASLSR